jgi:hypothetical protein
VRAFWQDVVLQLIGPVFATIVGTAILGFVAQRIARQTQDKREMLRIRDGFISDATEAAVGLYVATQRYWRAKRAHDDDDEHLSDEELAHERAVLDQQYRDSRVAGETLESRLYAYYKDDTPRQKGPPGDGPADRSLLPAGRPRDSRAARGQR